MDKITELNIEKLQSNFNLANEHLIQVFSKYPLPINMKGCPCCVSNDNQHALLQGDLERYLWKAMSTWGGEDDFKHYLPQLLTFVYCERKSDEPSFLISKLNYVKNWTREEIQAVLEWFSAYAEYSYIGDFKQCVEDQRKNVREWLSGNIQKLSCEFPFSDFLYHEFDDIKQFLNPKLLDKFIHLLDVWPQDEIDFIAYASCIEWNYRRYNDFGIFDDKITNWLRNNEIKLEELFWKTNNPQIQKILSDALPPNLSF